MRRRLLVFCVLCLLGAALSSWAQDTATPDGYVDWLVSCRVAVALDHLVEGFDLQGLIIARSASDTSLGKSKRLPPCWAGSFRKLRVTSSSPVAGSMMTRYRIFPRAATRHEPTTIPSRKVNTSSCMFTQVHT